MVDRRVQQIRRDFISGNLTAREARADVRRLQIEMRNKLVSGHPDIPTGLVRNPHVPRLK